MFGAQGSGSRVQSLGFGVWGLGFGVWGLSAVDFGQFRLWPILDVEFLDQRKREKKKKKNTKKERKQFGWGNQYSSCLCEGVAGRRPATLSTETLLVPAFRVSTGLHVEHRRPKAGDAPHEGPLKVKGGCLGFRVQVLGFRFQGLGFRV